MPALTSLLLGPSDIIQGHPWEQGGMKNYPCLGGREGWQKPTGPGFCITFVGTKGSLSPSRAKPTVLSPNPERSAIIDLASGPYPSGAIATARFTGCFRSVPALPSSDSTRLIEIGDARVLEWRGTPYSCQRLPGRADAPSYQTAH